MKARFAFVLALALIGATGIASAAPEEESRAGSTQVKPHSHPEEKGMGASSTAKRKQQAPDESAAVAKDDEKKNRPYGDKRRHYHPRDAK
jgi:hypothetical protein